MSETEYVSQMLTKIKRFAQHHDVHVWFVAHPRQLRDWRGQPPTMYDISGSAHFINKADNGVVIHRNRDPQAGPMNQVRLSTDSLSQPNKLGFIWLHDSPRHVLILHWTTTFTDHLDSPNVETVLCLSACTAGSTFTAVHNRGFQPAALLKACYTLHIYTLHTQDKQCFGDQPRGLTALCTNSATQQHVDTQVLVHCELYVVTRQRLFAS